MSKTEPVTDIAFEVDLSGLSLGKEQDSSSRIGWNVFPRTTAAICHNRHRVKQCDIVIRAN